MLNNITESQNIKNLGLLDHALDCKPSDWDQLLAQNKIPKFRKSQIEEWLYKKGIIDPNLMANLPKNFREDLLLRYDWSLPAVHSRLESEDKTIKLLLRNRQNRIMETVLMRYENRTSLCVSTQVGCRLACSFCQTGKLGLIQNLKASDIISQLLVAQDILHKEEPARRISHVVFMGMGEPFDNFEASIEAANRFMAPEFFGLSSSRVTISTSGIAPKFEEFAKLSRASLAVSLHAANDQTRSALMPINKKYNLADLKEAMTAYQKITGRIITLEYILLKGINCDQKHAKDLVRYIHGLRVKVNLIPFNDHPGLDFKRPSDDEIRDFQSYLSDRGIPSPVRYSRGLDISAACGQLAAKKLEQLNLPPPTRREYLSTIN